MLSLPPRLKHSIRLIAYSMLVIFSSFGCNQNNPHGVLERSIQLYKEGDTQSAVIQLRYILQKDPTFVPAIHALNSIYAEMEKYDDIIHLLTGAEKNGVHDEGILLSLVDALIHQGKFSQALSIIDNYPEGFESAEGLTLTGHAYTGKNQVSEAGKYFIQALEKDSHYFSALIGLAQEAIISAEKIKQKDRLAATAKTKGKDNSDQSNWVTGKREQQDTQQAHRYLEKVNEARTHLGKVLDQEPKNIIANYLWASLDYLQGDHQRAQVRLEEILAIEPEQKESLYLSGKILLENGYLKQGQERLQTYIKSEPSDINAALFLGAIFLRQEKYDKALALLDNYSYQGQGNPEYLLLRGNVYLYQGDTNNAIKNFEIAYQLFPRSPLVKLYLAMGYLADKKFYKSIQLLEKILQQEPNNTEAALSLVPALLQVNEYEKARKVTESWIKLAPENSIAYYLAGLANESLGDLDQARDAFQNALKYQHDLVVATIRLANIYQQQKEPEKAIKKYQEALHASPYNPEILTEMALLEQSRGREDLFEKYLELARDRNPEAISCRLLLGSYYLGQGRLYEVQLIVHELSKFVVKDYDVKLFLGRMKLASGQYENAIRIFSELVMSKPDSVDLLTDYGTAIVKSGSIQDGLKTLSSAVGLSHRTYPEALLAYGQAFLKLKNRSRAVKESRVIAEELQRNFPDIPDGELLSGDIAMFTGEHTKAIDAYQKAYAKSQSTQILLKLSGAYERLEQVEKSAELLAKATDKFPNDIRLIMRYAQLKQSIGHNDTAFALYHRLLDDNPNNALVLNNLAWMYDGVDRKKSLELAERAYQVTPFLPEVIDTFGWFCVLEGRLAEGLNLLMKAVDKAPTDPEIRYHLAEALMKSGKASSAKEALAVALESEEMFSARPQAEALFRKLTREN